MIDVAFVSGQIGKAIYRDNQTYYSVEQGSAPFPIRAGEFHDILGRKHEFDLLENTDLASVERYLELSALQHSCLFLLLTLIDYEVSLSARVVAAQASDTCLENPAVDKFVRRRLLSVPLPTQYRSHRHEILSSLSGFQVIKNLLQEVFECQPVLDQLWAEWQDATSSTETDPSIKRDVEAQLIRTGFFEDVGQALSQNDLQRLNERIIKEATAPVTDGLSVVRPSLIVLRAKLQQRFFVRSQERPQKRLKLKNSPSRSQSKAKSESSDFIAQLIENSYYSEPDAKGLSAFESKNRVVKQISTIRELLHLGKNGLAEKYVEDLLEFQLGQGDREHAAMSLCSLAAISLDANQLAMADRLSSYAIKLNVYDPVVYTLRAEVLKSRGHFAAALKAYEEAKDRFPSVHYGHDGYADVLNEQGKFDESLKYYHQTQNHFPDDPVAFNGEVSVLRNKGELRAAVKVALRNTKQFSADGVTRATLAGCLSMIGKYDEAIKQYALALSLAPKNIRLIIGYCHSLKAAGKPDAALRLLDSQIEKYPLVPALPNTKAKLFQASGRFREALNIYEAILRQFPAYTPATFGGAAAKILLGRTDEALRVLPEEGMESELDWFGFRAYALAFVRIGENDVAAQKLQFGIEVCPWVRERAKLETALGFVELARNNTIQSIRILQKNLAKLEQRQSQSRLLLLAHSQAQRGESGVSKVLLGSIFNSRDPQLRGVQRQIFSSYKLFPIAGQRLTSSGQEELFTAELSLALAA